MRFGGQGSIWFSLLKGFGVTALYTIGTAAAWFCSKDQWYLPAGIRLVSLLFLPYRMWPFIFLGDAAALIWLRLPLAEEFSLTWAIASSLLLAPLASLPPLLFRQRLGDLSRRELWIPAIAGVSAVWWTLTGMAINYFLDGPPNATAENLIKLSVGYYLGMLMFVLPVLVWIRRSTALPLPKHLYRDSALAGALVAVLAFMVVGMPLTEPLFRESLMMLMVAPVAAVTFLHGWRGAALGIVAVNVGIVYSMPSMNQSGAHDPQAFVAQQGLTVAATVLFLLGTIISHHYRKARLLGLAEKQALKLARSSFLATERKLRSRAMLISQIQANLTQGRRETIRWLREHGHHAAAMDMTRSGVLEAKMFDDHMEALYPIGIEQEGLYVSLRADALSGLWGKGVETSCRLRGKPRRLSVGLQLTAYRCVCDAIAILADTHAGKIKVRARTWSKATARGIVLVMETTADRSECDSEASRLASLDIQSRVDAHGGVVRWHSLSKVSVLLPQDADADVDYRFGRVTEKSGPSVAL